MQYERSQTLPSVHLEVHRHDDGWMMDRLLLFKQDFQNLETHIEETMYVELCDLISTHVSIWSNSESINPCIFTIC